MLSEAQRSRSIRPANWLCFYTVKMPLLCHNLFISKSLRNSSCLVFRIHSTSLRTGLVLWISGRRPVNWLPLGINCFSFFSTVFCLPFSVFCLNIGFVFTKCPIAHFCDNPLLIMYLLRFDFSEIGFVFHFFYYISRKGSCGLPYVFCFCRKASCGLP